MEQFDYTLVKVCQSVSSYMAVAAQVAATECGDICKKATMPLIRVIHSSNISKGLGKKPWNESKHCWPGFNVGVWGRMFHACILPLSRFQNRRSSLSKEISCERYPFPNAKRIICGTVGSSREYIQNISILNF